MTRMINIIQKYVDYLKLQKGKFSSLESSDPHWSAGQKRFIDIAFSDMNRDLKIMDIACGDGVGLREFKRLGFTMIVGVEFNTSKIKIAKEIGYPVIKSDMHYLNEVSGKFDIIYSSHTLEHSLYPDQAIRQFHAHLTDTGLLIVVIPYPDMKLESEDAHVAREIIGSNIYDDAKFLSRYLFNHGFTVVDKFYDTFREPEIWLILKKNGVKKTIDFNRFSTKLNDPNLTQAFYLNFSYNTQKKSQV